MRIHDIKYLLVGIFLTVGCATHSVHKVSGVIQEDTQNSLTNSDTSRVIINISSPGGRVGPSLTIAEFLMDKNVTVNVEGICNSACSQVILPVADRVNFVDIPLIGFHWSPILDAEYYKNNGGNLSACGDLKDLYHREKEILSHHGLNQDFWKEVDKRLILEDYNLGRGIINGCRRFNYNFKHAMWYPTSEQLKNLYGLKFKGSVCADNYVACVKKIENIALQEGGAGGVSMVIGDHVYTTQVR